MYLKDLPLLPEAWFAVHISEHDVQLRNYWQCVIWLPDDTLPTRFPDMRRLIVLEKVSGMRRQTELD